MGSLFAITGLVTAFVYPHKLYHATSQSIQMDATLQVVIFYWSTSNTSPASDWKEA
jgi:hypothetical protein